MNTRRYPRTLQEAFGPYTSNWIDELEPPMDTADKIIMTACGIAAVVLVVFMVIGWVK